MEVDVAHLEENCDNLAKKKVKLRGLKGEIYSGIYRTCLSAVQDLIRILK